VVIFKKELYVKISGYIIKTQDLLKSLSTFESFHSLWLIKKQNKKSYQPPHPPPLLPSRGITRRSTEKFKVEFLKD